MTDSDLDQLKEFIARVMRRLLAERQEPAAVAKKREPIACVLDLRDSPVPELTDSEDPHDRFFHRLT